MKTRVYKFLPATVSKSVTSHVTFQHALADVLAGNLYK